MDNYQGAVDIIKQYYNSEDRSTLISKVCKYFDEIKNDQLTQGQIKFLISFASIVGIPQYMDMLDKNYQQSSLKIEDFDLSTLGAKLSEAELIVGPNSKLHRYQKQVLNRFDAKNKNRYILSAPTSFGKTFLVNDIIRKTQYCNIVLIFPTISLLSENYEKLLSNKDLDDLGKYMLHTLSDDKELGERNIWLFTPERFLSYIDQCETQTFDFIFIDEVYKIDNEFIIDKDTTGENERDVAYRIALEFATQKSKDLLLAGPYMEINLNNTSFANFVNDKSFEVLNYNSIEIVNKDMISVPCGNSKYKTVYNFLKDFTSPTENSIVYNNYKSGTETYAKKILEFINQDMDTFIIPVEDQIYNIFLQHIINEYGDNWIVVKAIKQRIGIHHGLVPKYIQKEIINLFNKGVLQVLISTTTITEGVNTSAKNIIITSAKKGRKDLRTFDAKNIAGRAGRFLYHYSGRVINIGTKFDNIISDDEQAIAHKNFDLNSIKDDVDFLITDEKYLQPEDIARKEKIEQELEKRGIPHHIIDKFKVIGPLEKISIFDKIQALSHNDLLQISKLIQILNFKMRIDWDGFQIIVDILAPYIKDTKLAGLVNAKCKNEKHSVLTVKLHNYLCGGFKELLKYNFKLSDNIDAAMRETADLIYNVFKYQLVKYLGIFDMMYRYSLSKKQNTDIDNIPGISILLRKLEHNALNDNARKLSDYGVPFKLVDYYEGTGTSIKQFDAYESYIDTKVSNMLS